MLDELNKLAIRAISENRPIFDKWQKASWAIVSNFETASSYDTPRVQILGEIDCLLRSCEKQIAEYRPLEDAIISLNTYSFLCNSFIMNSYEMMRRILYSNNIFSRLIKEDQDCFCDLERIRLVIAKGELRHDKKPFAKDVSIVDADGLLIGKYTDGHLIEHTLAMVKTEHGHVANWRIFDEVENTARCVHRQQIADGILRIALTAQHD